MADLADPAMHASLVDAAWSWRGGIDIWVNNAGADVLTGAAREWSFDEKLSALWQIDVTATIGLSRAVGERMKQAGGGVMVNVGWDGADRGMAGDGGQLFAAAKGAVMAFTRSLAHTLAPEVRVNCVAPGWIRTAWGEQASESWQRRAERESLSGRWGTPEDVARVVRFLVSPSADFVTGEIVRVNGGFRGP
jgi:3-oxoacyl-[acyl-carrier protein] reductase